jgi:hypothetical protein
MAAAFIMDFEDGTSDQYDGVVEDMQLGGKVVPGALYHGAGATETGWRVLDIWDDEDAFNAFAAEKIGPITQAHGLAEPSIKRVELAEARSGTDAEAQFAQVVTLAGVDAATFNELNSQVLPDGALPEACAFHVNGAAGGDWVVIDYWTSREARDTFMAERVAPAMQAAGADPPQIEDLDLHNTLTQ